MKFFRNHARMETAKKSSRGARCYVAALNGVLGWVLLEAPALSVELLDVYESPNGKYHTRSLVRIQFEGSKTRVEEYYGVLYGVSYGTCHVDLYSDRFDAELMFGCDPVGTSKDDIRVRVPVVFS